jgi:hypothetical protein
MVAIQFLAFLLLPKTDALISLCVLAIEIGYRENLRRVLASALLSVACIFQFEELHKRGVSGFPQIEYWWCRLSVEVTQ